MDEDEGNPNLSPLQFPRFNPTSADYSGTQFHFTTGQGSSKVASGRGRVAAMRGGDNTQGGRYVGSKVPGKSFSPNSLNSEEMWN